jgi:hypothetical protein
MTNRGNEFDERDEGDHGHYRSTLIKNVDHIVVGSYN